MASSLRLDAMMYGSAMLVDRLLAFFLLPLLTRVISPEDYGVWTQTAIAAGVLMPIVLFGFSTTVVRYFSGPVPSTSRRRYFALLAIFSLLIFLCCALAATVFSGALSQLIYGNASMRGLVPVLLLLLAADVVADYAIAWLRSSARMGVVAACFMLRSATRYGAVLALVSGGSVPLRVWLFQYCSAQLMLALAILFISMLMVSRSADTQSTFEAPKMGELLRFSAPLVLLAALTSLNGFVDRFVLVRLLGLEVVAVYAAAVALCTIPAAFYGVLGFTLFPELSRRWQARQFNEVSRLMGIALQVFLFFCLPMAVALGLTGSWVLPMLTTDAYTAEPMMFVFLGLSVTALGIYQILLYSLLLDGRGGQLILLAAMSAALNLTLNVILVPHLGGTGAAAAAAVSNWLTVALATGLVRSVLPWEIPWASLGQLLWRVFAAAFPMIVFAVSGSRSPYVGAFAAMSSLTIYLLLDWLRAGSIARSIFAGGVKQT